MNKSFSEIAGYEKEKKELQNLQEFLVNIDKYKKMGVRIPRGIVLHGVPGVGKTNLARAIACHGISLYEENLVEMVLKKFSFL